MADEFEAGSVVLANDKRAGTVTLKLSTGGLVLDGKRVMKTYPLDKVTGYRQAGMSKNKITVEIASEDDLELVFGGFKGKANAASFVDTLRSLI